MNLPLNIDIRQILLHMLNFVLLSGGLYFILYRPVNDFVLKRKKLYEDMDTNAQNSLKMAECKKNDYEKKLMAAEEEIAQMKKAAKEEAELSAKEIIEKAHKEASEILGKARALADYEKRESLHHANLEISKIAVSAAKKLVFESTSDSFDAFLNSAEGDANGGK